MKIIKVKFFTDCVQSFLDIATEVLFDNVDKTFWKLSWILLRDQLKLSEISFC